MNAHRPRALFTGLSIFVLSQLAAPAAWADYTIALKVPGSAGTLEESLEQALLLSALDEDARNDPATVLATARSDYTEMVESLYARGFYGPEISIRLDGREAAEIPLFSPPASVSKIDITVKPGPTFKFGKLEIGPLAPDTELPEGLRRGQPAQASQVRAGVRAALEAWRRAGHAKAEIVDQSIVARHADTRLDVAVRIVPGPKLRFGDVTVSGKSNVRAPRVRQMAGIPRGDIYNPSDVTRAAGRLRGAGTFRSVTISEAETPNADGTLDVDIALVDRAPRRIGAGIEYSTTEGLGLTGYWLHRNALGGGETFRIEGEGTQIGSVDSGADWSISARLERPAVYGADTRGYGLVAIERIDEPDYLERTFRIGVGASRTFSDDVNGDLSIVLARSRVTDRFRDDGSERAYTLLSFPGELSWDRRDDPIDAREGFFLSAGVTPFAFLANNDLGMQTTLDARAYQTLGERVVLAQRLQLGSIVGPEAAQAPPNMLFYSGGSGTVRGQSYQSLGAQYGSLELGGRSLGAVSLEARFAATDKIGVVVFADAGQVGGDSTPFGDGEWHAGAGIGGRYTTPIGPVRLDVAMPVKRDTDSGVQLYLGIGQAF